MNTFYNKILNSSGGGESPTENWWINEHRSLKLLNEWQKTWLVGDSIDAHQKEFEQDDDYEYEEEEDEDEDEGEGGKGDS